MIRICVHRKWHHMCWSLSLGGSPIQAQASSTFWWMCQVSYFLLNMVGVKITVASYIRDIDVCHPGGWSLHGYHHHPNYTVAGADFNLPPYTRAGHHSNFFDTSTRMISLFWYRLLNIAFFDTNVSINQFQQQRECMKYYGINLLFQQVVLLVIG